MTKEEMLQQYKVLGFAYGFCIVEDLISGERGTLDFRQTANGREYFNFVSAGPML